MVVLGPGLLIGKLELVNCNNLFPYQNKKIAGDGEEVI